MSEALRLLVCDIDGTLIRKDKSLGDPVVSAIGRLLARGVLVSLISARPISGMLAHARRLGLTAPLGAFNGGTLFRPDGSVISAAHLEPRIAARALEHLAEPGVDRWLFADGRWYATTEEGRHVPSERITAAIEPVIAPHLASLTARVDKLVGVSDDFDALAALETKLAAALGADANVARSQDYYLDVTAPAADKGTGVAAIAKALGVSLAQTAVIGDGRNDIEMFKVAGFSIAMGQGAPEVRAAADAVTGSNIDDGVAQAIDDLLLPRVAG